MASVFLTMGENTFSLELKKLGKIQPRATLSVVGHRKWGGSQQEQGQSIGVCRHTSASEGAGAGKFEKRSPSGQQRAMLILLFFKFFSDLLSNKSVFNVSLTFRVPVLASAQTAPPGTGRKAE